MDTAAIKQQNEVLNAIITAAHSCGMKLKANAEVEILAAITAKGATATVGATGLELKQGSTEMVISSVFKTLRAAHEDLFVYDPRHAAPDEIVCRADFHGTPQEIIQRKAKWMSEHGEGDYERLPQDHAEAESRAVVPSALMNRAQYLCLSLADKSRLAGIIGSAGVAKIMARTQ